MLVFYVDIYTSSYVIQISFWETAAPGNPPTHPISPSLGEPSDVIGVDLDVGEFPNILPPCHHSAQGSCDLEQGRSYTTSKLTQ